MPVVLDGVGQAEAFIDQQGVESMTVSPGSVFPLDFRSGHPVRSRLDAGDGIRVSSQEEAALEVRWGEAVPDSGIVGEPLLGGRARRCGYDTGPWRIDSPGLDGPARTPGKDVIQRDIVDEQVDVAASVNPEDHAVAPLRVHMEVDITHIIELVTVAKTQPTGRPFAVGLVIHGGPEEERLAKREDLLSLDRPDDTDNVEADIEFPEIQIEFRATRPATHDGNRSEVPARPLGEVPERFGSGLGTGIARVIRDRRRHIVLENPSLGPIDGRCVTLRVAGARSRNVGGHPVPQLALPVIERPVRNEVRPAGTPVFDGSGVQLVLGVLMGSWVPAIGKASWVPGFFSVLCWERREFQPRQRPADLERTVVHRISRAYQEF
jgi:hypothetical protein